MNGLRLELACTIVPDDYADAVRSVADDAAEAIESSLDDPVDRVTSWLGVWAGRALVLLSLLILAGWMAAANGPFSWQALAAYAAVPVGLGLWVSAGRVFERASSDAEQALTAAIYSAIAKRIASGEIVVPLGEVRFVVDEDGIVCEAGSAARRIEWASRPTVVCSAAGVIVSGGRMRSPEGLEDAIVVPARAFAGADAMRSACAAWGAGAAV